MIALMRDLWNDESGQAMVEYGVIAGVIAVAAIAILVLFREKLDKLFGDIANSLSGAPGTFTADGK